MSNQLQIPSFLQVSDGCYALTPFSEQGVKAVFSTRRWNLRSKNVPPEQFFGNLEAFSRAAGILEEKLLYFRQVHSTSIIQVDESLRGCSFRKKREELIEADAAMTEISGIGLGVFTADCAPLFFMDSLKKVIGMAHVGWRGAYGGLIRMMVRGLQMGYGTAPSDLIVGIGPFMRSCCYEVGDEFKEMFPGYTEVQDGFAHFQFESFISDELKRSGIPEGQLFDSGFCTACHLDSFFSYRKEGEDAGRIMSVICA